MSCSSLRLNSIHFLFLSLLQPSPPSVSPPRSSSRWDSWFTAGPEASACVRTQQCSSQHRQHAEHAMLQQQHGVAHHSTPQDAHRLAAAQDGFVYLFKRYDSENINNFNPQSRPVCREKGCPAVIAVPHLRHKLPLLKSDEQITRMR